MNRKRLALPAGAEPPPVSRSGAPAGVLHLVESLRAGGAERACVEFCLRLDRERYAPRLLTYRRGDALAPMLDARRVPWTRTSHRGWMDPRLLFASLRLIDGCGVRIVHSHLHGANLWGGALRRLRPGLRHVSHVHRMDVPAMSLDGILNRLWVSRSDVVVAVSDAVRNELVGRHGMPGDRVVTVYNGVDLERHRPPARGEREEARRRLGLQDGDAVVGIVARLRPEKDHETFLRAAAAVAASERRAVFLVAGDGPPARAKELEALSRGLGVQERVRFMGLRGDIREILLCLDVAILCSRTEAMPLAVLEYLASGLPVVCTAVGGLPEVLGSPPCGVLVPPGDSAALAGAVLGLLRDPARRRALSVAARTRAEQEFDVRRSVARLESVYERILSASPGAGGRR